MDIITLLKANIRYRRGSFISVLILTFIISLCLTVIISINYNVEKRADESLRMNNVGDLTSIIWDVNCTDTMLQKVEDNTELEHINIVKTITQAIEINGIQQGSSTFFMPYDQKKVAYKIYNRDELSFRINPEKLQPGEIYVPISFERLYNCKLGDKTILTVGDDTKSFIIKGFFEEPFMGNEMIGIKLALMNEEDFNQLYNQRLLTMEERDENKGGIRGYYLVNMYQNQNSSLTMSELRISINDTSGMIGYSLFTVTKEQCKSITLMLTQIISGIMMAFLILLFAVVLIVMGHSISTGIEMDYTNLGVLKAIGFSKSKLRLVFILEYVLAELIGTIIGIIGSIPAIYFLNGIFVKMTGLLSSVKLALGSCLIILSAVLLISALFIFLKTKAIIKVAPVYAISGGRDSIYFHSKLELSVEGKGLLLKMAFRQLTSNLKQYISSTVIVAILVFFLVTITLLGTSFDEKSIQESFGVTFCDVEIGYNPKHDQSQEVITKLTKEVEADITGINPIENSFKIGTNYFTVNGDEYHGSIYDDPTILKSIIKGRVPLYDNEIVITEIVAKELGIKIGDTVKVGNEKLEEEYMISGYFQCTNDLGRTIAISYQGAKKIMKDYRMDYVDYVMVDSNRSAEIVKVLEKKYGDKIDVEDVNAEDDFGDTIINSMGILNIVIYTISILFTFVVIIIVCGKVFLKERTDYGIYKALGFTTSSLRFQFALRFAMVAFIGSVFGIVLNIFINNAMMNALLVNIGITNFTSKYNVVSMLMPILVLTICFFVFAYFISSKIKGVDTKSLISND